MPDTGILDNPRQFTKTTFGVGNLLNSPKSAGLDGSIPNILWLTLQCLQNDDSESLETLAERVTDASTKLRNDLKELFNETDLRNNMQTKIENYRIDLLTNHTRNMLANITVRNRVSFSQFFADAKEMGPFCSPKIQEITIEPLFNNH